MSAVGRADAATDVDNRVAWMLGLLLAVGAFVVYWLSNRAFDAGRGDFCRGDFS